MLVHDDVPRLHWRLAVVTNTPGKQEATTGEDQVNEPMPICQKSTKNASIKACERIKDWTDIIRGPVEDVRNLMTLTEL